MPKQPRIYTPEEAFGRLADACARAEYCTRELRDKLRRMRVAPDDAEKIVRRLVDGRFADDERYARAFARQKASLAHWGRRKIAYALAAKSIQRDIAAEAIAAIDAEVFRAGVAAVVAAKVRSLGPECLESYEGRTRVFRHAASRGFGADEIAEDLRRLMKK